MLIDTFGHRISYLRVSITDRCNMRCVYCMPEEGVQKQPHKAIMRYEEIVETVRVFASLGVRAIRITGGEPLVRPDVHKLVAMIAAIPGIEDISMTTNALLLTRQAARLAEAGLNRVNISLDSLQDEKFRRITRSGTLEQVWRGIEAAEKYGLSPIKLNVVALRGVNDDEFIDLAALTFEHPWSVRFIELMPIGNQLQWGPGFPSPQEMFISTEEIKALLSDYELSPVAEKTGRGPAKEFRLKSAPGTIGFISALSDHFCGDCNRMRLTADGNLRPCLLSDREIPLLEDLRAGKSILPLLEKALAIKPDSHHLDRDELPDKRKMKEIGG